jgi:hypothetical protein
MSVMSIMNPFQQFRDATETILAAGTIQFNENGTSSAATIYSDAALTSSQSNPYTLDGYGRIIGDVYFAGVLRMVIKDSTGATVRTLDDNICGSQNIVFPTWSTDVTYGLSDVVKGSDELYYKSIFASNQGNNPTSDATKWSEQRFVGVYNANETYPDDVLVQDSNGILYRSLASSNAGNTPASVPAKWSAVVNDGDNLTPCGDFTNNLWQEGTSFAAIADDTFVADMWEYLKGGTMVHTVSKAADFPTVAESGLFGISCLKADVTTADVAVGSTDHAYFSYKVEGYAFNQIAQKPFVISFWHKHTKTGTYCVGFRNSGADRSFVMEYTQTTTNTWERAVLLVTASPTAGTWDYTNGIGIEVIFTMAAGSTFETSSGAWNTGSFFSTSNQVISTDNTANNFEIAAVKLEAGVYPTEFRNVPQQEMSTYAHRYLYRFNFVSGAYICAVGYVSAIQAVGTVEFPVEMRLVGTGTEGTIANFDVLTQNGTVACTNLGQSAGTVHNTGIIATVSSGSDIGEPGILKFDANSGNYWQMDSRL